MTASRVAALGNMPKRDGDYSRGQREIDEKYPAPGSMLDQPATENRPHRSSDRRKAGPGADRLTAAFLIERCADNGQAAGYQQGSSHTLNTSGKDQQIYVRSQSTAHGSQCENRHAQQEHQAAAKQIAERATHKNQRSQKQSVRLDYPLHIYHRCMKAG